MYSKRLDCSSLFRFCEEGKYWSITSEGKTFVFGDLTFPENWPFEAWRVRDGEHALRIRRRRDDSGRAPQARLPRGT